MKTLILLLWTSICFAQVEVLDVLFQDEAPNGVLVLETFPAGADSSGIASQLPSVTFTGEEYGPYSFSYTICSVARPDICKSDTAFFYHMDLGTIVGKDSSICDNDTITMEFSNLWDTLIVGADVVLDTLINIGDLYCCPVEVGIIRTPVNPDPSFYILDPACIPDTIYAYLECECCGSETIDCGTEYVITGTSHEFFIPDVVNPVTWSPIAVTGNPITVADPSGVYEAEVLIGQCTTTYVIEIINGAGCSVSIDTTRLVNDCNQLHQLEAITGDVGTLLWSTGQTSSVINQNAGIYSVTLTTANSICSDTITIPYCTNVVEGSIFVDVDADGIQSGANIAISKEVFLVEAGVVVDSSTGSTYSFNTGCGLVNTRIENALITCPDTIYTVLIEGDTIGRVIDIIGRVTLQDETTDDLDFDFFPQWGVGVHNSSNKNFNSCNDTVRFDAGYWGATSVHGIMFGDIDESDTYTAGDVRIAGERVELWDDALTGLLASTNTNVDGEYGFTNLPPNDYIIRFATVAGYTGFAAANVGNDAADSDVTSGNDTDPVQRYTCDDDISVSAGYAPPPAMVSAAKRERAVNTTGRYSVLPFLLLLVGYMFKITFLGPKKEFDVHPN